MARTPEPRTPEFNRAIKKLLEKHKVSAAELSRRLGFESAGNVNRWVQAADVNFGKGVGPPPHMWPRIEDALNEPRGTIYAMANDLELSSKVKIIDFGELLYATIKTINDSIGGDLQASLAEAIVDLLRRDESLDEHRLQMVVETYGLGRELTIAAQLKGEQLSFPTAAPKARPAASFRRAS